MKLTKVYGALTAALVAASIAAPAAFAAETKTIDLNTVSDVVNVKATITWKFNAASTVRGDDRYDAISQAGLTSTLNFPTGYKYSDVKIDNSAINVLVGSTAKSTVAANEVGTITVELNADTGSSVNKTAGTMKVGIDKGFTVTATVEGDDVSSKDAWDSLIDNDDLQLKLGSLSSTVGSYDVVINEQIPTPTAAVNNTASAKAFSTSDFGNKDNVKGSTSFTDQQKKDILAATNIDVTVTLDKTVSATTGVTLYLANSGFTTSSNAEAFVKGAFSKDTKSVTFSNVKLNPTGSTTTFFNHYALVSETSSGTLGDKELTSIIATLTLPDGTTTTVETTAAGAATTPAPVVTDTVTSAPGGELPPPPPIATTNAPEVTTVIGGEGSPAATANTDASGNINNGGGAIGGNVGGSTGGAPHTGVAVAVIPAAIAGAAIIMSRKRK